MEMRSMMSSSNRFLTRILSTATTTRSATFSFPKVKESGFEAQWRKLSEPERDQVEKEYLDIGKKDWHELTFDQMRALYTIAYGSPEQSDPNESKKVFFGTAGLLAASFGIFAFLRSFAKPAPSTMTPEYQEATRQYLLEQNANPIRGLSSKKQAEDQ